MGKLIAINISEKRGTEKKEIQEIASIIQKKGYPNIDEGLHDLLDEFAKENQIK